MNTFWRYGLLAAVAMGLNACNSQNNSSTTLLNASYDATRELYQHYNTDFQHYWYRQTGQKIHIRQSNGGSGKQAIAVQNGLKADVVTLALAGDINAINRGKKTLLPSDWQQRLPHHSTPYTSTIVFLVRKGNPKHIRDWGDLIQNNVQIITPNPKTSGGARWNILAAWAWAKHQAGGSDASAEAYLRALLQHVPMMDTGARAATITFTHRQLGDVLLAWENEAQLAMKLAPDEFEIVTPSLSILCEPPVAVVDGNITSADKRRLANAYLQHLYSDNAQRLIAQSYFRPVNPKIMAEYRHQFPNLQLVSIDQEFGGWRAAQQRFFSEGGLFDQLYAKPEP